jgi:alpha-L-fucosidase
MAALCATARGVEPPAAWGPTPSTRQRAWHDMEFYGLVCYGIETYTGQEWGYGNDPASLFNPSDLDTDQWARVVRDAGMTGLILVAKHHDGFCLWPSKYNDNYSVKNTPWKDGKGDVVGDLAASCRKYGLKLGMYLSPWDRNHAEYGRPDYVTYFHNQLEELLTQYGEIFEFWIDGAHGGTGWYGGARDRRTIDARTYYEIDRVIETVRRLQPGCVIQSAHGPDVRWAGNEHGVAGESNWCRISLGGSVPGDACKKHVRRILPHGLADGDSWIPAEANTTILYPKAWYWKKNRRPMSPDRFLNTWYTSVGRNAAFLLGLSIAPSGLIQDEDVKALMNLRKDLDREFAQNHAAAARVVADNVRGGDRTFGAEHVLDDTIDTYWATDDGVNKATLTLRFPEARRCNRLLLQEPIPLGQRVKAFRVGALMPDGWRDVIKATTIGYKRVVRFDDVECRELRIHFETDAPCLAVGRVAVYEAPPRMRDPVVRQELDGRIRIEVQEGCEACVALGEDPKDKDYAKWDGTLVLPLGGTVHARTVHAATGTRTDPVRQEFGVAKKKWRVADVDSEEATMTPAAHAIDGDPKTIWATAWKTEKPGHPHHLTIDLGETIELAAFTYLTRQDGNGDGLVQEYEVYVSTDGTRWGDPVAKGSFANIENNPVEQVVLFEQPAAARCFVKFVSLSAVGEKPFAVAAEIGVRIEE